MVSKNQSPVTAPPRHIYRSAVESFQVTQLSGAITGCSWHYHPEFQLSYVMAGSGKRIIGDHICPIRVGEITLLGSNLPHVWKYEQNKRPNNQAKAIVIHFREDFLGHEFSSKPEVRDVNLLLTRASFGLNVTGATRSQAAELIEDIDRKEGFDRLLTFLSLLNLLASSRHVKALSSGSFEPTLETEYDYTRIHGVCNFIQSHYEQTLTREAVASVAHLSPSALSRFFKKHTGKTLQDYIAELRIGHACRMLMDGTDPITQIALRCGFADQSTFNRCFKRLKNESPTEYRTRMHAIIHSQD